MRQIKVLWAGLLFALGGCNAAPVEHYANEKPVFKMEQFFNGKLKAWGVLRSPTGTVKRRFYADMEGKWNGNIGQLDELFMFDDGEEQVRNWQITKINEHEYQAIAGDVTGTATAKAYGNTMNWHYVLQVPIDGSVWEFSMDDWMFMVDEQSVINHTRMKKLGVSVGELQIFIQKVAD